MLVIGFSGRKQSGKDSAIDFLKGQFGNNVIMYKYGFADKLKEICMELFGLTYEQCYGTNKQKSSLTAYTWENMPLHDRKDLIEMYGAGVNGYDFPPLNGGFMTAREFMQQLGTGVFRTIYSRAWIDYLINLIKEEAPDIAFISDARFVNECEALKNELGAKIIRFTRKVDPNDNHPSEAEMDGYEGADAIIDNQNMTVKEKNSVLLSIVKPWIQEHLFDLVGE